MPQKPPDLDIYGNPITTNSAKPPDLDEYGRSKEVVKPTGPNTQTSPDTFMGGFLHSLRPGGESDQAAWEGAKGYAKGALLDLPSSMWGALKTIGGAITSPIETGKGLYEGIKNLPAEIADTTMQAGSNPEAFGRMMGHATGQPLATAGLMEAAPYVPGVAKAVAPTVGRGLEVVGDTISRHGAVSGMMPRFAVPRYANVAERAMGRGMRSLGQRMQIKNVAGTVVDDVQTSMPFTEGELVQPKSLPESNTRYHGDGSVVEPEVKPTAVKPENMGTPIPPKQLPPSTTSHYLPESTPDMPEIPHIDTRAPTVTTEAPITPPTTSGTPSFGNRGKPPVSDGIPVGEVVIVKKGNISPTKLEEMKNRGFELVDSKKNGDVRFKKIW